MKASLSAALFAAFLAVVPIARGADGGSPDKAFDVSASLGLRWKEKLGFTDSQAQKYATAEKRREDALRPLRGNLRDALQNVRDLVAANAADAAVSAALSALAQAQLAVAEANRKFDSELAAFLTPTQRAKLLVGMPVGDMKTEGPADKRTADVHEALTDGDLEQE